MPRRGFWREKLDPALVIGGAKVFLGEGFPECALMDQLLFRAGRDSNSHLVFCFEGLGELPTALKNVARRKVELAGLFILLDAEAAGFARRCAVVARDVTDAKIFARPVKARPGLQTISSKRFDFFVSPDNYSSGRIEDIIIRELAQYPEWPDIGTFEGLLTAHGHLQPHETKALVQYFISTRRPGMCGIASAFEAGVLNPADAAYANIGAALLAI